MDYREMMQFAPEDCQPTIVNTEKDCQEVLKKVAEENGKTVEELTEKERDRAMGLIGLCASDFLTS